MWSIRREMKRIKGTSSVELVFVIIFLAIFMFLVTKLSLVSEKSHQNAVKRQNIEFVKGED